MLCRYLCIVFKERSSEDIPKSGDKAYLAPEVLEGNFGSPVDIFSLGLVLLELCTEIYVPNLDDETYRLLRSDDPFDRNIHACFDSELILVWA